MAAASASPFHHPAAAVPADKSQPSARGDELQPHGRDGKGLSAHLAAAGDARDKSLP